MTACHGPEPLPTTSYHSLDEAKRIMVERRGSIHNVQAQCSLKITPSGGGKTRSFDGAIVMDGDTRVRLQTWKLTQTIFDLIVNDDGTFLAASDKLTEHAPDAKEGLAKLAEHLGAMLRGPDFAAADLRVGPKPDELQGAWGNNTVVVDRRTLTPERFVIRGDPSATPIELVTGYGTYDGLYWLRHVTATGDFGTLDVTFRNVELNGELNPKAFKPSRRAEKL